MIPYFENGMEPDLMKLADQDPQVFNDVSLFGLILYAPVDNFSAICRDGPSWVEPVLSKD